jgi:hypothetical protein
MAEAKAEEKSPLLAVKHEAEAAATKVREGSHKFFRTRFSMVAFIMVGVLAVIVFGYMFFGTVHEASAKGFSLPTGLLLGGLLILAWFFMPKIEKAKWLPGALLAAGVLIIALSVAFSGFGMRAAREITKAEACAAEGDCGRSADDFPVYRNKFIDIIPGRTETFYAVGKVAIRNYADYCLNVSPQGTFAITAERGWRIVYIEAYSGKKTLATVTSIRKGVGDCH